MTSLASDKDKNKKLTLYIRIKVIKQTRKQKQHVCTGK